MASVAMTVLSPSAADRAATLAALFAGLAMKHGQQVVFRVPDCGAWRDVRWQEFDRRAAEFGLAALARGLVRGDVGCILAATGYEWLAADGGLIGAGLVSAGIYPTEPTDRITYILNDSGAKVLFVDSEAQLAKALAAREACPALQHIVLLDPNMNSGEAGVIAIDAWLAAGILFEKLRPDAWAAARAEAETDDPAILIYTSGTTGSPKGAVISHAAAAWQVEHNATLYFPETGWTRPAFLPLCHIAERYFTFFAMRGGAISYLISEPALLGAAVANFQPHFILAVPRVYQKLRAAFEQWSVAAPSGLARAVERGLAIAEAHLCDGTSIDLTLRDPDDASLLQSGRKAVGLENARMLVSGGAPFPPDLLRWFLALGVPLLEMYGMSETGTIASNRIGSIKAGTVGPICDFAEVKLLPTGEVAVRGNGLFSHYLNKDEATKMAFDDTWFLTGDLGHFDADGHLHLTGRLKDIIITSGGKNIAPAEVEARLRASKLIADAVLVGDGRKFVAALVMIDRPAVLAAGIASGDHSELAANRSVKAAIEAEITLANAGLSRVEQVKRFVIIPDELSAEDAVLTPTLKIKRAAMFERYNHLIEGMYIQ